MSLQVWLPLNGDLNNQGLSDITITNNNATINNNGKIGQCYVFNGSNNYIRINYNFYNTQYSVSAWVYSTSASATQTVCCDRTATGSGFSTFLIGGKLRIDPGGNNVQWTTNYTYPINTWFHLCITYDGTKVSYYINGEFKESSNRTINSSYWGNVTSIGASQVNNSSYSNYLNGRLNDFRIYDHTLSDKEIDELSRGLILHYKMDSFINNKIYDCSGYYNDGNVIGIISTNYDTSRYNICTLVNGGTENRIESIRQNLQLNEPNKFSICVWIKRNARITSAKLFNVRVGDNIYFNFGETANNSEDQFFVFDGSKYWGSDIRFTIPLNEWHYWVGTFDGTTIKLYKDGVLFKSGTKTTTYSYTLPTVCNFLGASSKSSNALVSDIRIYSTVLSDDQIKELYNTSATIDNLGNIYSREYNENDNLSITKTGEFECSAIYDNDELINASILKTEKQIQGKTLYEY